MTIIMSALAQEIGELAAKLATEGWDRLHAIALMNAVARAAEASRRAAWLEAAGRAENLAELLADAVHEPPEPPRAALLLQAAEILVALLIQGPAPAGIELGDLPLRPEDWTLLLAGDGLDAAATPFVELNRLGFALERLPEAPAVPARCRELEGRVIVVAEVAWLAEHGQAWADWPEPRSEPAVRLPLLVAFAADSDDFSAQLSARRAGARLLLRAPVAAPALLAALAGLAWMPRTPYRVMAIDDDTSVLEFHAGVLRNAGLEVVALADPVMALEFLEDFSPEALLLDVEMPVCRGTDLAALLRQGERFSHIPILYLSAFTDIGHQMDARQAGGEDYLGKPVEPPLLVAAVLARARQFRRYAQAERERQYSQVLLDRLRNAVDAHAIVSIADKDGAIVDVNRKFLEISGYSREELIGRDHRIVKSGHHPPEFFQELWRTITAGRIWHGEIQNRSKGGTPYWVQSTIVPFMDGDGQPEQFISIRTEITEQMRLRADKERQGRLLQLLRQALQTYLASHDFSRVAAQLLDGMIALTGSAHGFLGEVLQNADSAPALKIHAAAGIAWNGVRMASGCLDSLVGGMLRTGEPVIANALDDGGQPAGYPAIEAFLGLPLYHGRAMVGVAGLANRPEGYDASLTDFLAPLCEVYASLVEAARLRSLQQRVIDDLKNAADRADRALCEESQALAAMLKAVGDPLNAILGYAQLLEMHGGLDEAALSYAREIQRAGDAIAPSLRKPPGRMEPLRLESSAPGYSAIPAALKPQTGMGRILVAEDHPANQAALRMQLDVLGLEVDLVGDGAQALLRWQTGRYDLLLADRNMPVMDGLALARSIREGEKASGGHLPIIAITAAATPEELTACRAAGMDDVLPKPIELHALRAMLERWLPEGLRQAAVPAAAVLEAGTPVLDRETLRLIVGSADGRQVRGLLDLFTSTAQSDLPGSRQSLLRRDGRALALAMHKLKSSAHTIGAMRCGMLAETLEHSVRNGQWTQAALQFAELEQALADVETAAAQWTSHDLAGAPAVDDGLSAAGLFHEALVLDDDALTRRQLGLLLASLGVPEVSVAADGEAALREVAQSAGNIDLLLCDLNMPEMDGIEFIRHLRQAGYQGRLVLVSGEDERLLQTASEVAKLQGMALCGTLHKPVTREALAAALAADCSRPAAVRPAFAAVSPDDILVGLRNGEFDVHFQPKVDAATLRPAGVEALARWRRPGGGMVPPDVFIKTAEQCDLIGTLSDALLTRALAGGARLAAAGFALPVAVNLSARWLTEIRLPDFILDCVHATGIDKENVILEVTETGVMGDVATALDILTRLRLKGFKLSIDDFGTGYASMEQLQRIPFGELKLDRGFVCGAIHDPAARAILTSSMDIAKRLKLTTVAEGVETEEELALVRGLGCDMVQGWLVAKAMPLDELVAWLREQAGTGGSR